eukprot:jgi/Mesvir1/4923/Mv14588-RA.1
MTYTSGRMRLGWYLLIMTLASAVSGTLAAPGLAGGPGRPGLGGKRGPLQGPARPGGADASVGKTKLGLRRSWARPGAAVGSDAVRSSDPIMMGPRTPAGGSSASGADDAPRSTGESSSSSPSLFKSGNENAALLGPAALPRLVGAAAVRRSGPGWPQLTQRPYLRKGLGGGHGPGGGGTGDGDAEGGDDEGRVPFRSRRASFGLNRMHRGVGVGKPGLGPKGGGAGVGPRGPGGGAGLGMGKGVGGQGQGRAGQGQELGEEEEPRRGPIAIGSEARVVRVSSVVGRGPAGKGGPGVRNAGHVPDVCKMHPGVVDGAFAAASSKEGPAGKGAGGPLIGPRRALLRKYPGGVFALNSSQMHSFTPPGDSPEHADAVAAVEDVFRPGRYPCAKRDQACGEMGRSVGLQLSPGSLGTCALIALGRNLLHAAHGAAIDAHDTVIRMGYTPVKGYEKHVGSRTDVLFLRFIVHNKELGRQPGTDVWGVAEEHTPSKFYLFHDRNMPQPVGMYHGLPYLNMYAISGSRGHEKLYEHLAEYIGYNKQSPVPRDELKPTNGLKLVSLLQQSGLCTRLDLYGFTQHGVGHYFDGVSISNNDASSAMLWNHVAGLEYYAYQVAMANGRLCMYD